MIGRWLAARAEAERIPLRTAEPELVDVPPATPYAGPLITPTGARPEPDLPDPDQPACVLRFNGDVDPDQVVEIIHRFEQRGRVVDIELDPRPTMLDHVWRWAAGPAVAGICIGLGIIAAYGVIDAITRWADR